MAKVRVIAAQILFNCCVCTAIKSNHYKLKHTFKDSLELWLNWYLDELPHLSTATAGAGNLYRTQKSMAVPYSWLCGMKMVNEELLQLVYRH